MNTICPKQGMYQWSCTYKECSCHLKEKLENERKAAVEALSIWVEEGGDIGHILHSRFGLTVKPMLDLVKDLLDNK